MQQAVQSGFLSSFPGLHLSTLRRHPPISEATIKGHLNAHRRNHRSTRKHFTTPNYVFNTTQVKPIRTHHVYADCFDLTATIFTDQTGPFILPSISGNKYVFVLYDFDSNYIAVQAIPSRTKEHLVTAYRSLLSLLIQRGLRPRFQRLDNEVSNLMRSEMEHHHVSYQLTPAGNHSRNAAERAIQTFKNHFISGLSSVNPQFPLQHWDKLLPQAELTLNLLRPSRINPKISAYNLVHGLFDYSAHPLAPPGIRVLVHDLPGNRKSWAPHASEGYYLGPALDHYRCYRVLNPKTNAVRISETVRWLPHNSIRVPTPSPDDFLRSSIHDFLSTIHNINPQQLPHLHPTSHSLLRHLQQVFPKPVKVVVPTVQPPPAPHPRTPPPHTPPHPQSMKLPRVSCPRPRVVPPTVQPPPSPLPRMAPPRPPLRPAVQAPLLSVLPRPPVQTLRNLLPLRRSINAVLDSRSGKLLEYRHLLKTDQKTVWQNGFSKELARLSNGRSQDSTPGTNTLSWINRNDIPPHKKPTYTRICTNYRPQKQDPYRVRCTLGGNLINYRGAKSTPTASLPVIKLLINSVLSTPGAKFCSVDIKDFYLQSTLPEPEYISIPSHLIPPDILSDYNLQNKISNGNVYAKVNKGMYGLPQAGKLAHDDLVQHLARGGYYPTKFTPGLFTNKQKTIQFALVVDDFGIKYNNQTDLNHFLAHLRKKYVITHDEGTRFNGIHLQWNYKKRECVISIPEYCFKALLRFKHPTPLKPQHSPYPYQPPKYGQRIQYIAHSIDPSKCKLSPTQLKELQEIIGTFRFYADAVDLTMLMPVSALSTDANNIERSELQRRKIQFLDYAATHPNATIKYKASDMHLWAHTDASYLSESKARSRAGGYYFLSSKPKLPIRPNDPPPPSNGAITAKSKIIDAVMSSAQEAETGAGYYNAKEIIPLRQALEELGHPQGPTPLQFDNTSATQILKEEVSQKRSKAMDMRYYWLRDRAKQQQFHIHWKSGTQNLADYFTKHHSPSHHKKMRSVFLMEAKNKTAV